MYFISFLTDALTMTNFLHYPQTFNSIKFEDHIVIILTLEVI